MPKGSNYEIKTTIAIDGEKAFKAAMDDVNRSMRVSDSELKKLQASFDAGGSEMDYFTGRARVLNREHEQQQAKVKALQKAVAEAAEMYGYASAQVQGYKIQLNNAEAKQIALAKAAQEANRDLEALGRDSNKIGRQIERGIGDAAEDAGEKLDSMFERVQKDVNALKTSVGFQVATEVGGFIVNAVQGVTGFVEENEELNRQLAITEYNISKYDFDWMTTLGLVSRATAITGNQEGALEAINNLVSTQVTNEELINAALEGILGVFITTGGALSLESLAEDARASVVNKEATGTYAEVLKELIQGVVIDDVNKALQATKSAEEALEIVTAYLTEAGFQTTTKSFEEQNKAYIEAATKRSELALKWAALAEELTPIITATIDGTIEVVDGLTEITKKIKESEFAKSISETLAVEKAMEAEAEKAIAAAKKMREENIASEEEIVQAEKYAETQKQGAEGFKRFNRLNVFQENTDWFFSPDSFVDWFKNLFSSAGAETLPEGTADPGEAGFQTMQEYVKGMQDAANAEVTAAQAAVATTIAQMNAEEQMQAAFTAGKNAMIKFGNGIAEGAGIPISNVKTMINQINAMLAGMASPAYGLGWGGITGGNIALYMDGQKVGGLVAGGVSRTIGRKVETKMTMK